MDMTPVSSSQLAAIGYDPATSTLHVRFADRAGTDGKVIPGALYAYDSVPDHHHLGLLAADGDAAQSVGRYFGQHIRGGGFAYRRLG